MTETFYNQPYTTLIPGDGITISSDSGSEDGGDNEVTITATGASGPVADHLGDATDAHDASAISYTPAGNVVATDVQSAITELDGQDTNHNVALSSTVHTFKGIKKILADGITEQVAVNEVKVLTVTGGAEGDLFTLTIGGNKSANIVMPAGGFANLTAATIDTAMAGGTLGYADADCVVAGSAGGPFTLTFEGANAATNIGNMTVTDATGAAAATVTDDGTGASVVGAAADLDITVSGLAVGDSLADVMVYATKASIATQVRRPAADFTVGAGKVTVAANHTNNSGNQYLIEFVDLT